jgi:hypothetical protein
MPQDQQFRQRVERIGDLVEKLEKTSDPAVRSMTKELVAGVMDLHATGVERILEIVSRSGAASASITESMLRDSLVSSLLILHGLHPEDIEARVARALAEFPGVEVIEFAGGSLRLKAPNKSEGAVRESLTAAAPDLTEIVIEKVPESGFVPLSALSLSASRAQP